MIDSKTREEIPLQVEGPADTVTLFGALTVDFGGVVFSDASVADALASSGSELTVLVDVQAAPAASVGCRRWFAPFPTLPRAAATATSEHGGGDLHSSSAPAAATTVSASSSRHHCLEQRWSGDSVSLPVVGFTRQNPYHHHHHKSHQEGAGGSSSQASPQQRHCPDKAVFDVAVRVTTQDGRDYTTPTRRIVLPSLSDLSRGAGSGGSPSSTASGGGGADGVSSTDFHANIVRCDLLPELKPTKRDPQQEQQETTGDAPPTVAAVEEALPDLDSFKTCAELHFTLGFTNMAPCVARIVNVMDTDTDYYPCHIAAPGAATPEEEEQWITAAVKERDDPTARKLTGLPYGCMSLRTVYNHCHHFFNAASRRTKKARLGPATLLADSSQHGHSASSGKMEHRWELLQDLDLSRYILGDAGIVPLLAVVSCCRGLKRLNLSGNTLSFTTAKKLFAVLYDHISVRDLSLDRNDFFESAGEEVLRLLKVNRRITKCTVGGNTFSPRLHERIVKQAEYNLSAGSEDPFNVLSGHYSYLGPYESVPELSWKNVKRVWALLAVAPSVPQQAAAGNDHNRQNAASNGTRGAGDEDSELASLNKELQGLQPQPPAGSADYNPEEDKDPAAAAANYMAVEGTLPMAVTAPLFSEVMRTVHFKMSKLYEDDEIRRCFSDITTLLRYASRDVVYSTYPMSYAKLVSAPLRVAATTPHRWADVVGLLQGLGEQHASVGINYDHYAKANEFFVEAVAAHMGPEVVDGETKAGLMQVLALISLTTLSGTSLVVFAPIAGSASEENKATGTLVTTN